MFGLSNFENKGHLLIWESLVSARSSDLIDLFLILIDPDKSKTNWEQIDFTATQTSKQKKKKLPTRDFAIFKLDDMFSDDFEVRRISRVNGS